MASGSAIARLIVRLGDDSADMPSVEGICVEGISDLDMPDDLPAALPAELDCHQCQGVRLLIIGHCLLGSPQRAAEFAAAVRDADLGRVANWPGAFAAIVIGQRTVTSYADPSEQFPLYYSRRGTETLLAAAPGPLAAAHRRAPDALTAAAYIGCPDVLPLWSGRSPYADVRRIPGGAVLHCAPGSVSLGRAAMTLPVAGRTLTEGAAGVRDALVTGLRARCAGHAVSADFSGGLDSVAVAFLAARYAAGPVTALSYHQPLAPAADLRYATRYAGLDRRLRLRVITGSTATMPFADLADHARLARLGRAATEPHPGWLAAGRSLARLTEAKRSGASLHLTGEGGDALLMAAPSYLATLARTGKPLTLLRHSGGYGRLRQAAPAVLAGRAVRLAGLSPRRALTRLSAALDGRSAAGRRGTWADIIAWWPPVSEAASWLTPAVRRRLAEIAADPATARAIPPGVGPAELSALTDVRRSGDAQRQLREVAAPLGLPVHAPFLDSAVIRAALSVPAPVRANPWSYKPLLRAALDGLLPAEVFDRRTKGDYSAEDYAGARAGASGLRGMLRDSRLADLGVIEPSAVLAALDRMTAGAAVPLGPLNMLLATEFWLRSRDDAQIWELAGC